MIKLQQVYDIIEKGQQRDEIHTSNGREVKNVACQQDQWLTAMMEDSMELKNKLNLEGLEFQHEEERISKQKAKRLYDEHILDSFEVGTYAGLQAIHRWLLKISMILQDKPEH